VQKQIKQTQLLLPPLKPVLRPLLLKPLLPPSKSPPPKVDATGSRCLCRTSSFQCGEQSQPSTVVWEEDSLTSCLLMADDGNRK
jgi:hypothetical protein